MAISLSAGVRSALSSIQATAALAQQTQLRLATGKKVNSALDNPTSFFTASGLNSRAGDLSTLVDAQGLAKKTLEAADSGIKAIQKLVETAKSTVKQAAALSLTDTAGRTALAVQYDVLRTQIDQLAADASFNGVNLLNGDSLTVQFNEDSTSNLTIAGVTDTTAGALAITARTAGAFATAVITDAAIAELDTATSLLRSQASTFGSNLSVVSNREEFTRSLIDTLKNGADGLVLADSNEEGANLLALNTRSQLGTTALSLASQADQSILRLF